MLLPGGTTKPCSGSCASALCCNFTSPRLFVFSIIWQTGTYVPKVVPEDDPYFDSYVLDTYFSGLFFKIGIYTLILLVVQCTIFTLILRSAKLRFAGIVLGCLIAINIIHSIFWLCFMLPLTLARLAIPTFLYIIAVGITFDAKIPTHVRSVYCGGEKK